MTTHVATVHWRDDRWIDVQLRQLEAHLPQPFKVYAFLNHMERDHSDRFHYSSDENIKEHSTKLNLLVGPDRVRLRLRRRPAPLHRR